MRNKHTNVRNLDIPGHSNFPLSRHLDQFGGCELEGWLSPPPDVLSHGGSSATVKKSHMKMQFLPSDQRYKIKNPNAFRVAW